MIRRSSPLSTSSTARARPIELLDEVEDVLKDPRCAPITWPIGMGKRLKGYSTCATRPCTCTTRITVADRPSARRSAGLDNPRLDELLGDQARSCATRSNWYVVPATEFDIDAYLRGELTPVFFGSAINNFGSRNCSMHSPSTRRRRARVPPNSARVDPGEQPFTGFVFKIQANMDPAHRDRVAFLRVCSGSYKEKGMKMKHVRIGRTVRSPTRSPSRPTSASRRRGWPGDIIGLHNHGTIQIGDTFTEGEDLKFTGIPYFAPSCSAAWCSKTR